MKQRAAQLNMTGAALNALTLPIYVLLLSPTEYGMWVLVSSIASFAALFEFGLSLSMQRAVADGNISEQHRHSWRILLYSGMGMAIVSLLGALYLSVSPSTIAAWQDPCPLAALAAATAAEALSNVNGVYEGVFFASDRSHKVGVLRILTALLRLGLIWLAIAQGLGVFGIASAVLATQAAETLFFSPHILRHLKTRGDARSRWRKSDHRYSISLNQWLLNLGQRFGFRALLLVVAAAPDGWAGVKQKQPAEYVLVWIAEMTIIYRAFEFIYLVIKSAMPAYYHRILTETGPLAVELATRTLNAAYTLSVAALLGLVMLTPTERLPANLLFLHSSPGLVVITAACFWLMLVSEPLQYRAMMRERMSGFPAVQIALFLVPIALTMLSGKPGALVILLSLLITRALYLAYLTRQNRGLNPGGARIMAKGALQGLARGGAQAIPLIGVMAFAHATHTVFIIAVALALAPVYTAVGVLNVLKHGNSSGV